MLVDFTGSKSSLTSANSHSVSTLNLNSVTFEDRGNYSCKPTSLHSTTITLHVLRREKKQKMVEKSLFAVGTAEKIKTYSDFLLWILLSSFFVLFEHWGWVILSWGSKCSFYPHNGWWTIKGMESSSVFDHYPDHTNGCMWTYIDSICIIYRTDTYFKVERINTTLKR